MMAFKGVTANLALVIARNAVITCLKIAENLKRKIGFNILTIDGLERISKKTGEGFFESLEKAQRDVIGSMTETSIFMKVENI